MAQLGDKTAALAEVARGLAKEPTHDSLRFLQRTLEQQQRDADERQRQWVFLSFVKRFALRFGVFVGVVSSLPHGWRQFAVFWFARAGVGYDNRRLLR